MSLAAALYGQAIGDALGVPYEFLERDSFHCSGMDGWGTHRKPAGTWSDDTSMALAICDSYRELGRIDVDDIRSRFEAWLDVGAYTVDGVFDVGNTTLVALQTGKGQDGEYDNGNGSLMRTIPLAFMDVDDDGIRSVSAITHAHPLSMNACVTAVKIARLLSNGESPQAAVDAVLGDESPAKLPREVIRSGGYVLDTLNAALWCLLRTDNYRDCVLEAVNLGSDTDTTAAVAGAFAGIVYGIDGIPQEWMDTLRGKDLIESVI